MALRVGGDFFFDPQPGDSPVNLVLIAGGVGINPLFSILLHIADLHGYQEGKGNRHELGTVKLYYSAKNTSELLFKVNQNFFKKQISAIQLLACMSMLPNSRESFCVRHCTETKVTSCLKSHVCFVNY